MLVLSVILLLSFAYIFYVVSLINLIVVLHTLSSITWTFGSEINCLHSASSAMSNTESPNVECGYLNNCAKVRLWLWYFCIHTRSMWENFFIFSTIWIANFWNVSASVVYFLIFLKCISKSLVVMKYTLDSVDNKIEARRPQKWEAIVGECTSSFLVIHFCSAMRTRK